VQTKIDHLMKIQGQKTAAEFHRDLGRIMWDQVGMSRSRQGLNDALESLHRLKEEFWNNLKITGKSQDLNAELERAGRVADFLELGELMARDALEREESCGGHFREEHQTPENEAKRNDEQFCHVACWEFGGEGKIPQRHQEQLSFEYVKLTQRSYK
jgi:succinate dehydrogenase / fumarate reductase flavoprotein subunit